MPSNKRNDGRTSPGALLFLFCLCAAIGVFADSPIYNFTPQGAMQADLNAGGHNMTNVASVTGTNGAPLYDTNGAAAAAQTTAENYASTNTSSAIATMSNAATATYVPKTTTVNGHALNSGSVSITPGELSGINPSAAAATTQAPNGPGGLAKTDSNGNLPYDPWSMVNYASTDQAFVVLGDSRNLEPSPSGSYGSLAAQLPWLKNHATFYNFAIGSALIPHNGAQGGQSGLVTPQTLTGTWSANSNTITLTASPSGLYDHELVSAAGIAYGAQISSVSGAVVTLTPPIGSTYSTTAAGSGASVTFSGNDLYDQFVSNVVPLLGSYKRVICTAQVGINDLSLPTSIATMESEYAAFLTLVGGYSNVVFIPQTIIQSANGTDGTIAYSDSLDYERNQFNTWLLSGQGGANNPVWDVARTLTFNTASPDGSQFTSDGLHPNAVGCALMASNLDNFLQAGGGLNAARHVYEMENDQEGVLLGPTNDTFTFDNMVRVYNQTSPTDFIEAVIPEPGYGSGILYNGPEVDDLFTPVAATTTNQLFNYNTSTGAPLIVTKSTNTGQFGVGSNVSGAVGTTTGATVVLNGSAGSITVSPIPPPSSFSAAQYGPTGSSTVVYACVSVGLNGDTSFPVYATVSNANAVTNSSNPMVFTVGNTPGVYSYNFYRVSTNGSPSTLGKISVESGATYQTGTTLLNNNFVTNTGYDDGFAASGTIPTSPSPGAGTVNALAPQITVTGSTSGTCTFSEALTGSDQEVVIHANGLTGTASWTFPLSFGSSPGIVATDELAASVVTSKSTTAVTITGSSSTGYIFLKGSNP